MKAGDLLEWNSFSSSSGKYCGLLLEIIPQERRSNVPLRPSHVKILDSSGDVKLIRKAFVESMYEIDYKSNQSDRCCK